MTSAKCSPVDRIAVQRILTVLFALFTLSLFVAGCGKPAASFVGKWHANMPKKTGNSAQDDLLAQRAATTTLEFKADQTATVVVGTQSIAYTYAVDGNVATLTMVVAPDVRTATGEPTLMTMSADGQSLTGSSKGGAPFTFARTPG